MVVLYDKILPKIQEAFTYGGGINVFQIRKEVIEAVDLGANGGNPSLVALRNELSSRADGWVNPEDFDQRSRFFETYCEAVFYLIATKRGISIEPIPRSQEKTPDFKTTCTPHVHFEVKTLDISVPIINYPSDMRVGLEANLKANEEAHQRGIGFATQEVSPHGSSKNWLAVVEQVLAKLDGNIKREQYTQAPTFLVADMSRTSIRVDRTEIVQEKLISAKDTFDAEAAHVSGQLWTIANHASGSSFTWLDQDRRIANGKLFRAGVLCDHPYIQGIIFTQNPWSGFEQYTDWQDSYPLLGIWNENCSQKCSDDSRSKAKRVFDSICTT